MEEPKLFADHLGVWVIKAPKDMPIAQIAMLQTTIAAYWEEYPGDPNKTEQFWNFLVGNGMANVPRETLEEA